MIECTLQPIVSKYLKSEDKKPRHGVYLQSMYWGVKGYGKKTWIVAVKINLPNYNEIKELYETDDEIVEKCIEFLNTPPKSKYGKRRKRKALYTFDVVPHSYDIISKDDSTVIAAKLKTKDQRNKLFWKAGPSI